MGLCKCPKRKVTNLFCFEHRVNVCEHCLVANHTKCIVQSYLQWLQDSDYNPNCRLCNVPLATRETTRLICYDLFHWACLNERAAQLPRNTAPAGYQCPSCSGPIFPPANLAGPVASTLREKLATVNWARAGLGLPLIDEVVSPEPEPLNTSDFSDWSSFNASAPRKVYDTRDDDRAPGLHGDCDDDKYRRRPALGWLAQLLRSRAGSRKRPLTLLQRAGLLLLLGLLGFLALLALMSRLGRAAADSDPNLDPLMNPHIRVGPS
ncbi:zinc finger protein-like 1 isoform X2 [Diceros bicornis minor]|uniref:zinc finger protein-like 1 isoform X2 n=1 Tax=Diceros bicornis minor TaxID=77932 RepID=UPI0026EB9BD1|nr:zinc finger protein-like 1 isoform X2 [Diceros bicornis minor]